jgi:hypothetical protein
MSKVLLRKRQKKKKKNRTVQPQTVHPLSGYQTPPNFQDSVQQKNGASVQQKVYRL